MCVAAKLAVVYTSHPEGGPMSMSTGPLERSRVVASLYPSTLHAQVLFLLCTSWTLVVAILRIGSKRPIGAATMMTHRMTPATAAKPCQRDEIGRAYRRE